MVYSASVIIIVSLQDGAIVGIYIVRCKVLGYTAAEMGLIRKTHSQGSLRGLFI